MKILISEFNELFGCLHIVTINFQAYFNEVLKVRKLKVKSFRNFQVIYTLVGESFSDCVIFIYNLCPILKFQNFFDHSIYFYILTFLLNKKYFK